MKEPVTDAFGSRRPWPRAERLTFYGDDVLVVVDAGPFSEGSETLESRYRSESRRVGQSRETPLRADGERSDGARPRLQHIKELAVARDLDVERCRAGAIRYTRASVSRERREGAVW